MVLDITITRERIEMDEDTRVPPIIAAYYECNICEGDLRNNPNFCYKCGIPFPTRQFHRIPATGWSTFHQVIGYIGIVAGIPCFIGGIDGGKDAMVTAGVVFAATGIMNLFAAFMIKVQTDMKHYLKEMSESLERIEIINLAKYK